MIIDKKRKKYEMSHSLVLYFLRNEQRDEDALTPLSRLFQTLSPLYIIKYFNMLGL